MSKINNEKQKQIDNIVAVLELSSLLLVGVLLSKTFISTVNRDNFVWKNSTCPTFTCIFIPLAVLIFIYSLWSFFNNVVDNGHKGFLNKIEIGLLMFMFTIVVIICGVRDTHAKLLFLFIIIMTTIKFGKKSGLMSSIISSIIILSLDIIFFPNATINYYFQEDLVLAGVFVLTALPLGYYTEMEREHIKYLENIANVDGLTELYNHRYFYEALSEKVNIASKNKTSVSVIFIDIDNFKYYNDLNGHQKGDYVLKKMGKIIKENTRQNDTCARYGGEEFALILPDTCDDAD
ncbi:MAG TPA: hypothetical protein DG753_04515 [Clostridium sp.]|nr:hypothetical protein [Clostridium sp.]